MIFNKTPDIGKMQYVLAICIFISFISSCGFIEQLTSGNPYEFTPKIVISGKVSSIDGNAVSGATVKLFMTGNTKEYTSTATDSTGHYASTVPSLASYIVVAPYGNDSGQNRIAVLLSDDTCNITFDPILDGVRASAANRSIRLYWTPISWASTYNIYYGTAATDAAVVSQTTSLTTKITNAPVTGTRYKRKLWMREKSGVPFW